jgi:hypothetical protein
VVVSSVVVSSLGGAVEVAGSVVSTAGVLVASLAGVFCLLDRGGRLDRIVVRTDPLRTVRGGWQADGVGGHPAQVEKHVDEVGAVGRRVGAKGGAPCFPSGIISVSSTTGCSTAPELLTNLFTLTVSTDEQLFVKHTDSW